MTSVHPPRKMGDHVPGLEMDVQLVGSGIRGYHGDKPEMSNLSSVNYGYCGI